MTRSILRALALLLLLPALAATTATAAPPTHHIEREGIAIDVTLEPVTGTAPLREGDDVHVRIEVRDTHTGAPISTLEPAGWMDILPAGPETDPNACKAKVQGFLGGSLLSIPSLDLNVFYVLAMNDNATISVVDPLFGFGGSKLLTMILLDSPGEDWVLSKDASELYVSMPLSNAVAVVDTATWKVRGNIEVGPGPTRLVLGDDGRLLWVAYAGAAAGASSGVSAIDLTKGQEIARLEIGVGAVELALADDGRRLFASSAGSADVAVVDTRAQTLLAKTPVGGHPVSLGASALAGAVWVADKDGALVALDAHTGAVRSRLEIEPGISQIRFTPDGRYGFVPNPLDNRLRIVDAARGRVIQTGIMEDRPDYVAFSDRIGYVRHQGSDLLLMVPLDRIGQEGAPIPVIDVPGGRHPAGDTDMPAVADTIVRAPGGSAVLIANPHDQAIYFYKEGMAAPMGHFQNYGRQPRAALVVDRSLREVRPGTYETTVKMGPAGLYDLAVFVDSPRVIDCFEVEIAEAPDKPKDDDALRIALRAESEFIEPGKPTRLRIEIQDADGTPRDGLRDVDVVAFLAPGIWQRRQWAKGLGDGVYEVEITPPEAGVYYVFLEIPSEKLRANNSPSLILDARPRQAEDPNASQSTDTENAS